MDYKNYSIINLIHTVTNMQITKADILNFSRADINLLKTKVVQLKETDAESWLIGDLIERVILPYLTTT